MYQQAELINRLLMNSIDLILSRKTLSKAKFSDKKIQMKDKIIKV